MIPRPARRFSFLLALALLAGCDPIHTIGSEDVDGGADGGQDFDGGLDAGAPASCIADGGCRCGFTCGYSDDFDAGVCIRQSVSCSVDGGSAPCADGGICLAPIVGGDACPVARCFQAVGTTSCTSDDDCPCGEACAASADLGAVCSKITTCLSSAGCSGGDCVEIYRNGVLCVGIRQCLDE